MIIFMGVAGSGKSSQGRMLADELGLPWLSTGEFLRMLIAGKRRQEMLSGKLLDDTEIIAMVRKIFSVVDLDHEFVLDGFPRTENQAEWLLGEVKYGQLNVTAVIHLQADESVVESRLLERARPDDYREAIKERFSEYEQSVKPILVSFQNSGVPVYNINGEQDPDSVHQEILSTLKDVHVYKN